VIPPKPPAPASATDPSQPEPPTAAPSSGSASTPSPLAIHLARELRTTQLLHGGETVCCAVSGGADSLALLGLMLELRELLQLEIEVGHVHHQIAEARSDEAAAAVQALAQALGLTLHLLQADVPALARSSGLSIEAAGHEVRRTWYASLCARSPQHRVATAHTADDLAETLLMRLTRGTGLRGLGGIRPSTPHPLGRYPGVVRPLLTTARAELRAYVAELGWPVIEDPTNQDVTFSRNRVRHRLLPLLEADFNPRMVEALGRLAESARTDDEFLEALGAEALGRHASAGADAIWIRASLVEEHPAVRKRAWFAAVAALGGKPDELPRVRLLELEDMLTGAPNRRLRVTRELHLESWPGGVRLARVPTSSAGVAPSDSPRTKRLPTAWIEVPGRWQHPQSGLVITLRLVDGCNPLPEQPSPPFSPPTAAAPGPGPTRDAGWRCWLDPSTLLQGGRLLIRSRRDGDRWLPAGHSTPRKLKDSMQRWQIPAQLRDAVPLLVRVSDAPEEVHEAVVAVCGYGVDAGFVAKSGTPRCVLLEVSARPDGESPQTIFKA
jgi:tRNA(Ile)-lysidine synthase